VPHFVKTEYARLEVEELGDIYCHAKHIDHVAMN
jgi:hypothetical protein